MNKENSIWEKQHAKDPNDYKTAKLTISSDDESDLYEITLTYINTLNNNGAWDVKILHSEKQNIITFKYNKTITPATAIGKLHFNCSYNVSTEWE